MARRSFSFTNPNIRHHAGATTTFAIFTATPGPDSSERCYFWLEIIPPDEVTPYNYNDDDYLFRENV